MNNMYFKVIFEDDFVIAVDKKSGLLSVPSPKGEKNTLTSLLNDALVSKHERAYPCHRLDRETSGLVLYAKDLRIQKDIMDQFRHHKIIKKYLAIAQGRVRYKEAVLKGYIKPKDKQSKFAITKFRVLSRSKSFSLLEVEPKTGRTNQIRLHLLKIGHPVVGERKYTVAKRWPLQFKRLCLHSYYLEFRHPESGDLVRLTSGIPLDMHEFLRSLGVSLSLKRSL